jgi:hypothetical protein
VTRAAALARLIASLPLISLVPAGCETARSTSSLPAGPSTPQIVDIHDGTGVVDDRTAILVPVNVSASGTLDASLTWTVTAAGAGNAGQTPQLALDLLPPPPPCIGIPGCVPIAASSPADIPPAHLSSAVQAGQYAVRIVATRGCGQCAWRFTLTIAHP